MASTTARVAVVACSSVMILAARPLPPHDAAAADGSRRGWELGPAQQALVGQMKLSQPGQGNDNDWQDTHHPGDVDPTIGSRDPMPAVFGDESSNGMMP
nr:unnamed protein product [Digitaria exilis]CAB3501937.1 unnamed protein product [Digitaria exilis]